MNLLLSIVITLPIAALATESRTLAAASTEVCAADWNPSREDATAALQGAIDSGATIVRVSNLGRPWIVRPITLRSNQKIIFEDGVNIIAMEGEFRGTHDTLFSARNITNFALCGEGTVVFRMHKKHYQAPEYTRSEWRHGIALFGCTDAVIENLTVLESGGDGVYISGSKGPGERRGSDRIVVRRVISDGNHRQGFTIGSGSDILVEECAMRNTAGTAPEAGMDIEPGSADQYVERVVIRNCVAENNRGSGFMVYLLKLHADKSRPIDITFKNCKVVNNQGAAYVVGGIVQRNPTGPIRFIGCEAKNIQGPGIYIYDKARDRSPLLFEDCTLRNVALSDRSPRVSPELIGKDVAEAVPNAPVVLFLRRPNLTETPGGLEFRQCRVEDGGRRGVRPVVVAAALHREVYPWRNVTGLIYADHADAAMDLGDSAGTMALKLESLR